MKLDQVGYYLYMQEQEEKRKATANDRNLKGKEHLEREQTAKAGRKKRLA